MRIRICISTFGFLGNGVTFFLTALIVVRHLWFSGGLSSFFKPAVSGTQYLLDSSMIAHGNMRHTDVPDTPLFGMILVLADRDSSI